jgi:hypothetical protein
MFIVTLTGDDGQEQWLGVNSNTPHVALQNAVKEYERLYEQHMVAALDWAAGVTVRPTLDI